MPKISVIVPIYNAEKYLERCVKSLIAQTFHDIEILLIDDGSTDASSILCARLKKEDSRIRILHKPNGGLSSARNAGLLAASGAFIGFVDADDTVSPTFLKRFCRRLSSITVICVLRPHTHRIRQAAHAALCIAPRRVLRQTQNQTLRISAAHHARQSRIRPAFIRVCLFIPYIVFKRTRPAVRRNRAIFRR